MISDAARVVLKSGEEHIALSLGEAPSGSRIVAVVVVAVVVVELWPNLPILSYLTCQLIFSHSLHHN